MLRRQLGGRYSIDNMVGNCNAMRMIYEQIVQVADSTATVLVRGESGTGKELIARAIHFNSPRKNNTFVSVNCAALPENLIESEFFGHEKGASPVPNNSAKGALNSLTEAPFSSMRSGTYLQRCRCAYCVCCRRKVLSAWVATKRLP